MQAVIDLLIKNAKLYKQADQRLEVACGENYDPIACTIYAKKGIHTDQIPIESHDAAFYLNEVVKLCGILVQQYNQNSDYVRSLWFPILNQ